MRKRLLVCSLVSWLVVSLSACQLNTKERWLGLIAQATPTSTSTPTVTPSPTNTATPTPSPTPTHTPSPTATPVPSDRLALAQRAYANGNYDLARQEFAALLADPGANPEEQRLALHWRGRSELRAGDAAAAITTLKLFLEQYPSDELARAAQFNLGAAYEQNNQLMEAFQAYLGAIIPDDLANIYIYERAGDVALKAGAYEEAINAYQNGLYSTQDTGFQVHLREGMAEAELARNDPRAALAQYDAILRVAQIPAYRAKILRLAAEAHLAAGETEAAYERYLEAVNRYPEAYDSYLSLVELVNAGVPVDEFQRGLVDYYAGVYEPAITAFDRYLNSPPVLTEAETASGSDAVVEAHNEITATTNLTATGVVSGSSVAAVAPADPLPPPYAAEATWLTALSWQALGRYNSAISVFQRLIEAYPNDANWGKAHLEIGKSQGYQGNISQATATFRDFAAENPNHPLAPEALWRAGRLEFDEELYEEAARNLSAMAETYPTSDYASEALYWAGQAAFMIENYEEAGKYWEKLFVNYPNSTLYTFGGYWQARALLELNQDQLANDVLVDIVDRSDDYYGLRARDLLAGVQPHSVPLVVPTPAQLIQERTEAEEWLAGWLGIANESNLATLNPRVRADLDFQRGEALLKLGLRREALLEFEKVKDNWWNDALAMYQLSTYFAEQGLGQLSIVTAARLVFLSPAEIPEEAPIFIQRLYYPIFFADLIFAEAAALDLDPALLLAIMRQESLFEQSAESIAGARGLMQVMPPTGEYVAQRSDFGDFNTDHLWLPYVSVKFGAWYINQQLGMFNGNQFAALAAYNAGPGNVFEWLKASDDLDIFVESIPFRESRLYIRRIYVNLAAYRRIYGVSTSEVEVN